MLSRRTDLHVFHFQAPLPLGGDLDAFLSPRQIVDWAARFKIFDRFVLGNHPPTFFRVRTKLPPQEYLDAMTSLVDRLRDRFHGRLFSGIECDFLLPGPGKIGFNPGERLLSHYNPDASLIAFHFHHTLTYAKRHEIAIADLVNALRWAVRSGMFSILAHPFDVLGRVYREDRSGFEEIANLARQERVAIEINADKGFDDGAMSALIKNGNFFSFGGDLHAFSYWLKRDTKGLEVGGDDKRLVERVVGLTREAADKEKRYWKGLDPLFWNLSLPSGKREAVRNYSVQLYKRFWGSEQVFERGLERVKANFGPNEGRLLDTYLRDLYRIYTKWGGAPNKKDRERVERYFLQVPLTAGEIAVYESWLAKAFKLGLKKEQLINNWDTPRLESFLHH